MPRRGQWVNAPIGLVAILISLLQLPESHGPATRLDVVAALLAGVGASSVVWGLVRAGDDGWQSPVALLALGLGGLLLAAFIAWEARAQEPMLPLRLFRRPGFVAANVSTFLMAGALNSAAFLVSQYMQFSLGLSPLGAGVRVLPWTATPLLIAPAAGMLSDRIGRRPVLVTGMLLQGVGLGWFALIATTGAGYGQLVAPLVVAGVGISMALPIAPATIVSAVLPHDIGKASGVNSTLQRFGAAFAIAIVAAVFAAYGHLGTPVGFDNGFRPALAVAAALSVLGAVVALGVASRRTAAVLAEKAA